MPIVHRIRPAMATTFEAWLVGDDEEHLDAVAGAALDEIRRVERLLSRFDPAAEVARVNREAAARPVRVDRELLAILLDARSWWERTDGSFDILAAAGARPGLRFDDRIAIDPDAATVRFLDPAARIDLGGYGKGYALDAAARVVAEFGIRSAFLHGGTSSALARGVGPDGHPWQIALRDPFANDPGTELGRVELVDCGFSSSATLGPGMARSDILDPRTGTPQSEQAAVSAIAPTAAEAEVLSTALLAMGKDRGQRWQKRTQRDGVRVAWIDRDGVEWL
ncbi:FAD:protein FMN transferase [Tundrisphaera sp. TA3]|uniref:FAD:protein FMN transferase n=1 Tax=Tundrisphaera sp. TA3 TaxID=3435775 RepID=UPI003EBE92A3